jgi:ABC-2 type transport system ATP-binding protein
MAHMLEADSLTKSYGDAVAVAGISFDVDEGEIFGLLGPNGAGKTTTISMLTGVLEPTSGTARIDGHDLLTEPAAVKRLNGLVPQDLALYPTLSARSNLQFFGRIYGLSGRQLRERVDDVLEIVALTDRANEPVERYSGGMKRRVNIAAGLVHQPRLLFLDEPTVGVDPQSRNHIFESVQRLNRERRMTIIYTSHYMEEVELLCGRVAIIDQGRVIALDTIRNLVGILGGGVIQLGVSRLDEGLLAALRTQPAIKDAQRVAPTRPEAGAESGVGAPEPESAPVTAPDAITRPGFVKVEAVQARDALVQAVGCLGEHDVALTSVEIFEPNLESVFLHLTGKKLRE